jgi:hypothetical protein
MEKGKEITFSVSFYIIENNSPFYMHVGSMSVEHRLSEHCQICVLIVTVGAGWAFYLNLVGKYISIPMMELMFYVTGCARLQAGRSRVRVPIR